MPSILKPIFNIICYNGQIMTPGNADSSVELESANSGYTYMLFFPLTTVKSVLNHFLIFIG